MVSIEGLATCKLLLLLYLAAYYLGPYLVRLYEMLPGWASSACLVSCLVLGLYYCFSAQDITSRHLALPIILFTVAGLYWRLRTGDLFPGVLLLWALLTWHVIPGLNLSRIEYTERPIQGVLDTSGVMAINYLSAIMYPFLEFLEKLPENIGPTPLPAMLLGIGQSASLLLLPTLSIIALALSFLLHSFLVKKASRPLTTPPVDTPPGATYLWRCLLVPTFTASFLFLYTQITRDPAAMPLLLLIILTASATACLDSRLTVNARLTILSMNLLASGLALQISPPWPYVAEVGILAIFIASTAPLVRGLRYCLLRRDGSLRLVLMAIISALWFFFPYVAMVIVGLGIIDILVDLKPRPTSYDCSESVRPAWLLLLAIPICAWLFFSSTWPTELTPRAESPIIFAKIDEVDEDPWDISETYCNKHNARLCDFHEVVCDASDCEIGWEHTARSKFACFGDSGPLGRYFASNWADPVLVSIETRPFPLLLPTSIDPQEWFANYELLVFCCAETADEALQP